ncbi:unnamed protein product [Gordionus sp. m RMFG-2023]
MQGGPSPYYGAPPMFPGGMGGNIGMPIQPYPGGMQTMQTNYMQTTSMFPPPLPGIMGPPSYMSGMPMMNNPLMSQPAMFAKRGSIDAAQAAVSETIKAKHDFPFMSRCTLLNLCMDIYESMIKRNI